MLTFLAFHVLVVVLMVQLYYNSAVLFSLQPRFASFEWRIESL